MFAVTRTRWSSVTGLYQKALEEAQRKAQTGPLVSFLQTQYADESKLSSDSPSAQYRETQPFGGSEKSPKELRAQTLENLQIFLSSKATYADLLVRYNPQHDMTEEERVRLSARRVGLDIPLAYNDSTSENKDISTNYRSSAKLAQDRYGEDQVEKDEKLYSGKGDGINFGGPLRPPE